MTNNLISWATNLGINFSVKTLGHKAQKICCFTNFAKNYLKTISLKMKGTNSDLRAQDSHYKFLFLGISFFKLFSMVIFKFYRTVFCRFLFIFGRCLSQIMSIIYYDIFSNLKNFDFTIPSSTIHRPSSKH